MAFPQYTPPPPASFPGPRYWKFETSGELAKAVAAYLDHARDRKPVTIADVRLLRAYFVQWIENPFWQGCGLEELRDDARLIDNLADVHRWVRKAVAFGADPL